MSNRLPPFVPAAGARVLVVGDVILDRYLHGDTTRISPEAPVPVVRVGSTEERPGGAANVALNLRALGIDVELAGVTGADAAADNLSDMLRAAGIACRFLRRDGFPTITKVRVLSQHQQLLRLDYEAALPPADDGALLDQCGGFAGFDCVVLSDYAKGGLARVGDFIRLARSRGVPVLVDPKGADFARYAGATVLTPNLKEFEQVVGACADEGEIGRKGEQLRRELDLDGLLVTRGERGMTLVQAAGPKVLHVAARAHEVYDVTGAGDTVIATLAAAMVSGHVLPEAMQYANAAAGLVVEKLGTASATVEELNARLAGKRGARRGVLTRPELEAEIDRARRRGERIAMTNGCFDILHAGHVRFLEQARALGDRLVVAVNDDASVQRLKGAGRPINAHADRMAVLAALGSVDWVIGFSEDTPRDLIAGVLPDVLAKGGDYRPDQVAGAAEVAAAGGQVVILPLVPGRSSTGVIDAAARSAGRTGRK